MKELKKYSNKTKAALVLLIVMFMILLSNFNTLQNSKKANEDTNAIYNDRLVVARYIFQYANELHSIKATAAQPKLPEAQKQQQIAAALKKIHTLNALYLKTVLTPKEKISFKTFRASCSAIQQQTATKNWNQVTNISNQALQTLELLSQIQIEEGKAKVAHSNALHSGNNSLGELQIALLIVLGGVTLFLLIVKKKKITIKIPQPPSMN